MHVRDMMQGLQWGMTYSFRIAHIMAGRVAYCGMGVWAVDPPRHMIEDMPVCKRCLKATERYA